jgi:hypothetical protein
MRRPVRPTAIALASLVILSVAWPASGRTGVTARQPLVARSGVVVAGNGLAGFGLSNIGLPVGIAVGKDGSVYVADATNMRVVKWAPNATAGIVVAGTGQWGTGLDAVANPSGIALDTQDNLYVSDADNHRVTKWEPGAQAGVVVAGNGAPGANPTPVQDPGQLFVDVAGNLYVQDANSIVKFPVGTSIGTEVARDHMINSSLASADSLDCACGFTVDGKGVIYAADSQGAYRWNPGQVIGTPVAGMNLRGLPAGLVVRHVNGIAVDAQKNIYMGEQYSRVVQWPYLRPRPYTVAGTGLIGSVSGGKLLTQLSHPGQILLDTAGRIYIADTTNHRVVRWPAAPNRVTPPSIPIFVSAKTKKPNISFSWKTPTISGGAPILKYKIRYSVRGASTPKVTTVYTTGHSFTVKNAKFHTFYFFKLTAINRAGESLYLDLGLRTS